MLHDQGGTYCVQCEGTSHLMVIEIPPALFWSLNFIVEKSGSIQDQADFSLGRSKYCGFS